MGPRCLMSLRSEKGTGGGAWPERQTSPGQRRDRNLSSAHQTSCDSPRDAAGEEGRLREVGRAAQGHTAKTGWNWHLNPGSQGWGRGYGCFGPSVEVTPAGKNGSTAPARSRSSAKVPSFPATFGSETRRDVTLKGASPTLLPSPKVQLSLCSPPPSCWPSSTCPRAPGSTWVWTEEACRKSARLGPLT